MRKLINGVYIQMAKHSLKWLFSLASRGEGSPILVHFLPLVREREKKREKLSWGGLKFGVLYFILIKQTHHWRCREDIIYIQVITKCENYANFYFFFYRESVGNIFLDGYSIFSLNLKIIPLPSSEKKIYNTYEELLF